MNQIRKFKSLELGQHSFRMNYRKEVVDMTVIRREKPVVLTGRSASTFLKDKKLNEKKVQNSVRKMN